jgi:ArsR family transcriptional regulator
MAMKRRPKRPRERYEARARIAKALAHPSRQLMLDALSDGELCVGELTQLVGADQSTVSKHLAVLRQAGLVQDRKDGSMTLYGLRVQCLDGFWKCLEAVLEENLTSQKTALGR